MIAKKLAGVITGLFFSLILNSQNADSLVRNEEFSFKSMDAVYKGTLSMPSRKGPFPLVILVSGMGPQDRNWSFSGGKYNMAKIIADHLNLHGIAVYRYDDRGYKESTGAPEGQISFEDLSKDILVAVSEFRKRPDIGKIGLCGHSLGGILSVISVRESKDIDFIITLSGSFMNGADIMREQARTLKRWRTSDSMTDDEVVQNGISFVDNLVSYAENGTGKDKIEKTLIDLINYQVNKLTPEKLLENLKIYKDREEMIRQNYDEAFRFYTSPHQKSFVTYNAANDIMKITCPALFMFGELDKHVVVSSNLPPVLAGLKNFKTGDFTIRIIPGADHSYSNSDLVKKGEMIPGTLEFITNWIISRCSNS